MLRSPTVSQMQVHKDILNLTKMLKKCSLHFFLIFTVSFLQSSVHKSKYTETTPSTVCFSNPRWRAHRLQGRLHSTQPVTETAQPVRTSNLKDHYYVSFIKIANHWEAFTYQLPITHEINDAVTGFSEV